MPQLVPDCVKRWLGDEAEGTAQYSLLNTPKWCAIARLIGTCSGEYMRVAVPPSDAVVLRVSDAVEQPRCVVGAW